MRGNRFRVRGSYTVESVFLFPMIVFLLAFLLQLSVGWYENVHQEAENTETLRQLDARKYFLNIEELKAVKDMIVP